MQKFTTIETQDLNGNPYMLRVPSVNVVCWNCRGNGTTVNPAIDGNGLSDTEAHREPEFIADYMSGVYDVPCGTCNGERVMLQPDVESLSAMDREIYNCYEDELAATWIESEGERRMGA